MALTTFIAWSGGYSKIIAEGLKEALSKCLPAEFFEMKTQEDLTGRQWFSDLKILLNNSDAVILVLTPECRKSWWMPWELGMLHANPVITDSDGRHITGPSRDTRVFPMVFHLESVEELGPIKENYLGHSQQHLERLLYRLAERHLSGKVAWSITPGSVKFKNEVWEPFNEIVKECQAGLAIVERREAHILKQRSLLTKIQVDTDGGAGTSLEDRLFEGINALLGIFRDEPSAFEGVVHLIKAADRCLEKTADIPDAPQWVELENKLAIDALKEATAQINRIAKGQARQPPTENSRRFYISEILRRVQTSMWTVNVGWYEGSFGRELDSKVLHAHVAIKQRNPDAVVTRVFVVSTKSEGESAFETLVMRREELSEAMRKQEKGGVRVLAITDDDFSRIVIENAHCLREIGSEDFNILDETRVYSTRLTGSGSHRKVDIIEILSGPEAINAALKLRDQIEEASVVVKNGDLSELR